MEKDEADLSPTERDGLIGDSSNFTSEDYGKYVDDLRTLVTKKRKVFTNREQTLMSGVFLKEQEIKHLINLGLGCFLKELKIMTEMNMIFANGDF